MYIIIILEKCSVIQNDKVTNIILIKKMKRVASHGQYFYYHTMKTLSEAFIRVACFWKQGLRCLKKFDDNAQKNYNLFVM